jgi:hypothetical protein
LRPMPGKPFPPVIVLVTAAAAAEQLAGLLEDYFAVLTEADGQWRVSIEPIDELRRGTVLYRVIQASRTVANDNPDAAMYLVTEEGSRWRLPPPAL